MQFRRAYTVMRRPMLARLLPDDLGQLLYYRYYHTRHHDWLGLFDAAPLRFAPNVSMFGLVPGDVISGTIAFTGFYELGLSRRIAQLARKKATFVDVGANMGYFSLLWAGVSPSGRVLCFEAAARNVRLLENNIVRNRLSDQITLVAKAAGNRSGTIAFNPGPVDQTGWGSIAPVFSANALEVPVVRLDQELGDLSIDVLKIDVEGADTWVLFGCEELLRKKQIGTIFFEQNLDCMQRLGIAPGEAQAFLTDLGYACAPLDAHEEEWIAHPNRSADL